AAGLRDLPPGARVGTASVRRRAQLLARRPDLAVTPLRGNVDTRLRRWREGAVDALVLAAAGLERLGIAEPAALALAPEEFLPPVGQGALALECRADAPATRALLAAVEDPAAATAVAAERGFLLAIGGDCNTPLAAHATVADGQVALRALVTDREGQHWLEDADSAPAAEAGVRLKNGGPCLLGRGGEEAEALRRAGVPFEIVPGVSSAFAVPAYAGIPLTHRDHASLVTIATGHQARVGDEVVPPALPWEALARHGGTLVFLMGMRQMPAIMAALIAHGLPPDTPAAAIQSGTTGAQTTVVASAATLAGRVRAAGRVAPGVVVVGCVVTLH